MAEAARLTGPASAHHLAHISPSKWEIARRLAPGALLLVLVGVLAFLVRSGPPPLDLILLRLVPQEPVPLPLRALNRLASAPTWTALALGAAVLLWRRGSPQLGGVLVLADVSGELVSLATKLLVDRHVPGFEGPHEPLSWWDALSSGYMFPSGHVMRVTVVLGFLVALLSQRAPRVWVPAVAASATVLLLIGAARVAVHAHLPTDVLGGYLLGGAWLDLFLVGGWWLDRRVRRENLRPA